MAWGSRVRYLAVSGLLHSIVLIVLGGTVLYRTTVEPPDFTSEGGLITDDIPFPVPEQEALQIQNPDLSQTAAAATAAAATATTVASASAQMAAVTTDRKSVV